MHHLCRKYDGRGRENDSKEKEEGMKHVRSKKGTFGIAFSL